MQRYIANRILMLFPVLLGVSFLTFCISQVTPGDPAKIILGNYATPESMAALREELGLDDPLLVQYGRFLWNALHGDLGTSYRGGIPVTQEVLARFPRTLELSVAAMVFAVIMGVVLGTLSATSDRSGLNVGMTIFSLLGISVPNFWLAIILIIVFGIKLGWVPVISGEGIRDLILPAFCLGVGPAAILTRLTRSSVREIKSEVFVTAARSKGLRERTLLFRHVLPNALIPIVTVMGLQFGNMLGGAVFIEAVFARPGLGTFAIKAINARDYPQVIGTVLFSACVFMLVNLIVDLLYGVIDPRIRQS